MLGQLAIGHWIINNDFGDKVAQAFDEVRTTLVLRVSGDVLFKTVKAHDQNPRLSTLCLRLSMALITSLATKAAIPSLMRRPRDHLR